MENCFKGVTRQNVENHTENENLLYVSELSGMNFNQHSHSLKSLYYLDVNSLLFATQAERKPALFVLKHAAFFKNSH